MFGSTSTADRFAILGDARRKLHFHGGRVTLHHGDCMDVLARLPANSIDSIVTDPPYHLTSVVRRFGAEGAVPAKDYRGERPNATGAYARASRKFTGRSWDGGDIAFRPELWAEVLRVLKPGGHLVAFSATRNSHRMVCAIEDAGFEIRDSISYLHKGGPVDGPLLWCFGSGFPKSRDIGKALDANGQRCACEAGLRGVRGGLDTENALSGGAKQDMLGEMRGGFYLKKACGEDNRASNAVHDMRKIDISGGEPFGADEIEAGLLQPFVLGEIQDGTSASNFRDGDESRAYAGSEGEENRSVDWSSQPGMEGRGDISEEARELRQRSLRPMPCESVDDGASGRLRDGASACDGGVDQAPADADGVCPSPRPQPASERESQSGIVAVQSQSQDGGVWPHCGRCGKPIVPDGLGTALKPAYEPICLARKPVEGTVAKNVLAYGTGGMNIDGCRVPVDASADDPALGRWPANVLHDGSEEVVSLFPSSNGSGSARALKRGARNDGWGMGDRPGQLRDAGKGSAARFFYSAKASKEDRAGSAHPTVKPIALMRWLVRLITPPGGVVLDPFAGTGTTGQAAIAEGCSAVLIEREDEYRADIERRMNAIKTRRRNVL